MYIIKYITYIYTSPSATLKTDGSRKQLMEWGQLSAIFSLAHKAVKVSDNCIVVT
jgi:hypothetical protein